MKNLNLKNTYQNISIIFLSVILFFFLFNFAYAAPSVVGTYTDSNLEGAWHSVVVGDYAYVVAPNVDNFNILDVSDVENPVRISTINDSVNLDGVYNVFIKENYAYVVSRYADTLSIIDISNPNAPFIVSSLKNPVSLDTPVGVFIKDNYAYVATRYENRLTAVDISDPNAPFIVSSIKDDINLDGAWEVRVVEDLAYVTARDADRLTIIDISNPASMFLSGSIYHSDFLDTAYHVAISGNYAYVTARDDGQTNVTGDRFTIIDISNPASLSIISSIEDHNLLNGAKGVEINGTMAYVTGYDGDSFVMIDVFDPASPFIFDSIQDSVNLDEPYGITFKGGNAYIASGGVTNGLTIIRDIPDTILPDITVEAWIPDDGGTYIVDGGVINLEDIDEVGEFITIYSNASDYSGIQNHKITYWKNGNPQFIGSWFTGGTHFITIPGPLTDGDLIEYQAEATDNASSPNTSYDPSGGIIKYSFTIEDIGSSNNPPTQPEISIDPSSPDENDDLICQINTISTDVDGDTITYTYEWFVDANPVSQQTIANTTDLTDTLSNTFTSSGETWKCVVTPNDGTDNGIFGEEDAHIESSSSIPEMTSVTITPNPAYTYNNLKANPDAIDDFCEGADVIVNLDPSLSVVGDGCHSSGHIQDSIEISIPWTAQGEVYGRSNRGAVSQAQTNESFYLEINGVDGPISLDDLDPSAITSRFENLGSFSFMAGSQTVYMNTASQCPPDDDPNSVRLDKLCIYLEPEESFEEITYFYQWIKNVADIEGETDEDLTSDNFIRDDIIKVTVIPYDGINYGLPMTSDPLTISNSLPTQPTVSINNPAYEDEDLTCSATNSTDVDGDTITYTYEWFVDANPVSQQTIANTTDLTDTLSNTFTSSGETWKCVVAPYDGADYGTSGNSTTVILELPGGNFPSLFLQAEDNSGSVILDNANIEVILANPIIIKSTAIANNGGSIISHVVEFTNDNWASKVTVDCKTVDCSIIGINLNDYFGFLTADMEIKYKAETTDNDLQTKYSEEYSFNVIAFAGPNTPPTVTTNPVLPIDYCVSSLPAGIELTWNFDDIEDSSIQTGYEINLTRSDGASCNFIKNLDDSISITGSEINSECSDFIDYGGHTYTWEVKVYDSAYADSGFVAEPSSFPTLPTPDHQYPTANFSYSADDDPPLQFQEITFDPLTSPNNSKAYGGASIDLFKWDFDDGNSLTSNPLIDECIVTHFYSEEGPFTVDLKVEDSDGYICWASQQGNAQTITINGNKPSWQEVSP